MFLLYFCLVLFKSGYAFLNYDTEQNMTIGNWTLGPQVRSVIPLVPPGFMITFTAVRSPNIDDPVIGYKLYVEEKKAGPPTENRLLLDKIKAIDDVVQLIQSQASLTHLFSTKFKGSPFEIDVPVIYREFMYRIRVLHVQLKTQYSIKVQAYTKASVGPWSEPARGYIDSSKGYRLLKQPGIDPKTDGYYPLLGCH